jgi:hypothetical protein
MRDSARPAGHPLRRLARRLLGRNELRRAADRIETAVIFSLVAAFLIAAVAAACFAGHGYQSEQTAAARLRPAVGRYCPSPVPPPPQRAQRRPGGEGPTEPNGPAPSPR